MSKTITRTDIKHVAYDAIQEAVEEKRDSGYANSYHRRGVPTFQVQAAVREHFGVNAKELSDQRVYAALRDLLAEGKVYNDASAVEDNPLSTMGNERSWMTAEHFAERRVEHRAEIAARQARVDRGAKLVTWLGKRKLVARQPKTIYGRISDPDWVEVHVDSLQSLVDSYKR